MLHSKTSYHIFTPILWGSFVLGAILVLVQVVSYFSFELNIDLVFTNAYEKQGYFWRLLYYMYLLSVALSIVCGALLMLKHFKKIKEIYILSILLLGAPVHLYLAYYISGGWLTSLAFVCTGICWFYSTWKTLYYLKNKLFKAHNRWLYRSFAFTLSPITLYLFIPALAALTSLEHNEIYKISAWNCGLLNLIICEFWVIKNVKNEKA